MTRAVQKRRGFMLIIVLATMALIAAVVTDMTYHAGVLHAQLQRQRLDASMRYSTESAAAYVRSHADDWVNAPPEELLELEPHELIRGAVVAEITIDCGPSTAPQTCKVGTKLVHHRRSSREFTSIRLVPAAKEIKR